MSVESARAFCMRMMSDDEFRESLGKAGSAEGITALLKKENYEFNKHDLLKIVGELSGKKLTAEELETMVCEFYAEEVASGGDSSALETVQTWFRSI